MRKLKFDKSIVLVLLISLPPLVNLLTPGLLISHDAWLHAGRLASFYQSLLDGIIIPRWAGNLNLGFGHPILMFVYPLPSYVGSFLHFLGISYADSIKIILASSYILSGVFMYLWIKEFLGKNAGIIASTLYLFAPYRFIDLYVRGAVGEHMAFIFLPMIMYALLKINKIQDTSKIKNSYVAFIITAFSFMLLILSHNAISLIFIPFIVFYVFFLYFERKSKRNLLISFFSLAYGAALSSFFWLPAFSEGKYTLRDIVTAGEYSRHFINPVSLIYGPWDFGGSGHFSIQIGIVHIIILICSIIFFKKIFNKKREEKLLYLGTFVFLISSIFLMTSESNLVWQTLSTLPKIQFPWRFLAMVAFYSSLVGAITVSRLKNKLIIALILLSIIIPTFPYWHAKNYDTKYTDIFFENEFKSTTDTGETSPIWSIRFMENPAKDTIEIIDGKSEIKKLQRKSNYHEYVINAKTRTRFRENTLYFPGWKAYDNGKQITNIEFQDPANRGLITFYLNPGMHNVILRFEDTKLRNISNLISAISLVTLITIFLLLVIGQKVKFKI